MCTHSKPSINPKKHTRFCPCQGSYNCKLYEPYTPNSSSHDRQARVDKIHGLANSLESQAKVHIRNNIYAKIWNLPLQETRAEDK